MRDGRTPDDRAEGAGDQARIARQVGVQLADAFTRDGRIAVPLDDLSSRLPQLGGGNAERDVFVLALAEMAAKRRDLHAFAAIAASRGTFKREDPLLESIGERALSPNRASAEVFA